MQHNYKICRAVPQSRHEGINFQSSTYGGSTLLISFYICGVMLHLISHQELLIFLTPLCYAQSIVWFLARWSRTYLMSSDGVGDNILNSGQHHQHNSREALINFFGEHNQGKIVLDIMVRISLIALTAYPGEKFLQV